MDLEEVKLAYSKGKKVQSLDCDGKWYDFVPQNQLDRPNWEWSDQWRVKPDHDKSEELREIWAKKEEYDRILTKAAWIEREGWKEIVKDLRDLNLTEEQAQDEGFQGVADLLNTTAGNLRSRDLDWGEINDL